MSDTIRSKFTARAADNTIVFSGLAVGGNFDTHDAIIESYIKRSRQLGGTQFEVVAK